MSDEQKYSPGVKKYIKEAEKFLDRKKRSLERIKNFKFDTIAVHGLYTVEEALSLNQGSVIEHLVLHSLRQPDHLLSGMGSCFA